MTDRGVSLDRLKERLEREPCAGAMHLLAETYQQQGLYHQAAEVARRALSLYPENLELRLILGESLVSLGEFAEAEDFLKPVAREIGVLGEVFAILQRLYEGQARETEANQAGHLYRLLKGPLFALLTGKKTPAAPPPSPPEADRSRLAAARSLEVLEKWQGALQAR